MMRINLKSTSVHNFLSANLAYQLIKLIRMDSSTAQIHVQSQYIFAHKVI